MMKEFFGEIKDERQQAQVRHELCEIIAMTIAAVIGNCDCWEEIEDFCISVKYALMILICLPLPSI